MTKIAIIGNCQIDGIARSMSAMVPDLQFQQIRPADIAAAQLNPNTDIVLLQDEFASKANRALQGTLLSNQNVIGFPGVYFTAFHPDFVFATVGEQRMLSPAGGYNSAIAVYAWKNGFSVDETINLYKEDVFRELGYFDHWELSANKLLEDAERQGLALEEELELWRRTGCFLHCPNHPKVTPLAGLARTIVKRLGLTPKLLMAENYVQDSLARHQIWPVYPSIAQHFGLRGEFVFRGANKSPNPADNWIDLDDFVAGCFEMWKEQDPDLVKCARFSDSKIERILKFKNSGHRAKRARNPYSDIKDYQLWKRAVAAPEIPSLDPVTETKFKIGKSDKVATAGSCFAQHISRALAHNGYNYFVTEEAPSLNSDEAAARNYSVFSARYGNIYTTRQLVQLIDRSEDALVPIDTAWRREDGRLVDPFRPQIEPAGFANSSELEASRTEHFAAVRRIWRECDVLVFTLGLTETWMSKIDGAAFPLAPGVSGGEYDEAQHVFQNMSVQETVADLRLFLQKLRVLNPKVRVILTVSPVPLIATAEDRHVLVSTTYSKAVLRAAAQEVSEGEPLVQYFPSYEIITGAYNRGIYFEDDLRSVTAEGVEHVMRVFLKHFSDTTSRSSTRVPQGDRNSLQQEIQAGLAIVCDEEEIERAAG